MYKELRSRYPANMYFWTRVSVLNIHIWPWPTFNSLPTSLEIGYFFFAWVSFSITLFIKLTTFRLYQYANNYKLKVVTLGSHFHLEKSSGMQSNTYAIIDPFLTVYLLHTTYFHLLRSSPRSVLIWGMVYLANTYIGRSASYHVWLWPKFSGLNAFINIHSHFAFWSGSQNIYETKVTILSSYLYLGKSSFANPPYLALANI